ncbi:uncharacterized protein [Asterias amurensis]|uniref:uncharacterized protein n=1 Tax=Asterias amurensis TaxID=7602 RepID=UPI003AB13F6E
MAKVLPPASYLTVKRGPSAPLSGSSSEGENSDLEDIPPSPCSSTSSGPIYIRPAGFKHHAQEIQALKLRTCSSVKLKKKIKKNAAMTVPRDTLFCPDVQDSGRDKNNNNSNSNKLSSVPQSRAKQKTKKDPLPMKLRALPQSFWQQPNTVNTAPPGAMYTVLPPVSKTEQPCIAEITDVRPVTPTSDQEAKQSKSVVKCERLERPQKTHSQFDRQDTCRSVETLQDASREGETDTLVKERIKPKQLKPAARRILRVSATSSNLLAKLFDGIEKDKKSNVNSSIKRGRPKRDCSQSHHKHVIGEDPYLIDAVADGLLPLLSIESHRQSVGPSSHLSVVAVKDGDKMLTLPSLSIEQNYPAMLSELVKAL